MDKDTVVTVELIRQVMREEQLLYVQTMEKVMAKEISSLRAEVLARTEQRTAEQMERLLAQQMQELRSEIMNLLENHHLYSADRFNTMEHHLELLAVASSSSTHVSALSGNSQASLTHEVLAAEIEANSEIPNFMRPGAAAEDPGVPPSAAADVQGDKSCVLPPMHSDAASAKVCLICKFGFQTIKCAHDNDDVDVVDEPVLSSQPLAGATKSTCSSASNRHHGASSCLGFRRTTVSLPMYRGAPLKRSGNVLLWTILIDAWTRLQITSLQQQLSRALASLRAVIRFGSKFYWQR
jgi:hypothetical protein